MQRNRTIQAVPFRLRRTLLTVIAIAGAMAIGSMSLVMWASFENALYASVDDYEEWDVILEFSFPLNDTTAGTLTSSHITDSTYISRIGGIWHKGTKEGFALVIGLESGQTLHKYNIDDGRVAHGPNEVMVNRKAAEEAGIHKGDTITIDGPLGSQSFTVTALVEDYIGNFFVDIDAIDALAGEKVYAGAYLETADGMASTVKKEMLQSPLVTEAQTRDSMTSGLFDMMESYGNMMYIMSLLGVAIAAPTLANIVFVNILERYPEYGQLRAIGYTKGSKISLLTVYTMFRAGYGHRRRRRRSSCA